MPWTNAVSIDRLEQGPVVWKDRPRQIALFKVGDRVFAIDNRCPHEGYPLAQGTIDQNCLLTCNWHNWKFRLDDGQCVLGGDNVRSYAVRVEDGQVWVNTDDPPPEQIQQAVLDGLQTAFNQRDYGRICREIARLHYAQLDPLVAVRRAVAWSHDRFEFGFTHAYAVIPDWLELGRSLAGDFPQQLVCLAEPVDHMAFDALRHPVFSYPTSAPAFDSQRFLAAVESEDHELAEALALAAVEENCAWDELESIFATAALDHYNDFGHSLIYVLKTRQAIDELGSEVARYLLPALARHLSYTTREDLIPEFRDYGNRLAQLEQLTVQLTSTSEDRPEVPFPATTRAAFQWLSDHLEAYPVPAIYDAMLEALARNMLHFDTEYQDAYDRPVTDNVGWLDFTHGVTFANAVRLICQRHPELWRRGLLQMACFIGRNHGYLDLDIHEAAFHVSDAESFFEAARPQLLDHGLRDPIFSAHLLKTTRAVREEWVPASEPCRAALLAALNRFWNSPLKQKHAHRLARQAVDLVKRDYE